VGTDLTTQDYFSPDWNITTPAWLMVACFTGMHCPQRMNPADCDSLNVPPVQPGKLNIGLFYFFILRIFQTFCHFKSNVSGRIIRRILTGERTKKTAHLGDRKCPPFSTVAVVFNASSLWWSVFASGLQPHRRWLKWHHSRTFITPPTAFQRFKYNFSFCTQYFGFMTKYMQELKRSRQPIIS